MRRLAHVVVIAALVVATPAFAQPIGATSYILIAGYADKGEACGLIAPWEAAAMRAEARRFLGTLPADERRGLVATTAASTEALVCDDPTMVEFLATARPGIEREWLPQHLALFHALAGIDRMPMAFLATALPIEFEPAIAIIEQQFAAWQAAGIQLEGAASYDEYLAAVRDFAIILTQTLNGIATEFTPDEAAATVAEAGLVGRLWLLAQARGAQP